ncbi:hypothetical protein HY251_00850 [bacterium]|nr:hypothetical protein [bacterium]
MTIFPGEGRVSGTLTVRRETMETIAEVKDTVRKLEEAVKPSIEKAHARISGWNARVVALIEEHPGKCVLGALALGYLVGRLARRR